MKILLFPCDNNMKDILCEIICFVISLSCPNIYIYIYLLKLLLFICLLLKYYYKFYGVIQYLVIN